MPILASWIANECAFSTVFASIGFGKRKMVNRRTNFKQSLKRTLYLVAGLWVLGAVALGVLVLTEKSGISAVLHPAAPAPMFVLPDQTGRTHKLEDYSGRAVVVAFLPDSGPETRQELASIESSIRVFDTMGVKIFGIGAMSATAANSLHDELHLDFPILLDKENTTAKGFGIDVKSPASRRVTFVIGGNAKVLLPIIGVDTKRHGPQIVGLTECCLDSTPAAGSRFIGLKVPDFKLPSIQDGKMTSLFADHSQRATVLFIMSSECPCSGRYDTRFIDAAREFSPLGVRFVAMNSSFGESRDKLAAYVARAKYPFPVLKDADNILADKLEARVTPEVFVFDSHQVLRYHGRIDDNRDNLQVKSYDLEAALKTILSGKVPVKSEQNAFGCAIERKSTL